LIFERRRLPSPPFSIFATSRVLAKIDEAVEWLRIIYSEPFVIEDLGTAA
jgi:hypothetical protein